MDAKVKSDHEIERMKTALANAEAAASKVLKVKLPSVFRVMDAEIAAMALPDDPDKPNAQFVSIVEEAVRTARMIGAPEDDIGSIVVAARACLLSRYPTALAHKLRAHMGEELWGTVMLHKPGKT
jgi:hypothetical protein